MLEQNRSHMVRRTLRSRPAARNAGHDTTPEPHDAMNDLEVNKVVAAILSAGVLWMGATLISDALVSPTLLKKTAIAIAVPQAGGKPPPELSLAALLQTASAKRGEADTQRVGCTACHSFTQGGPAIVGPPLYGVVGRPVASVPGFDYSAALKAHHGPWTYAELNNWITKPAAYAPGTKMTFAGLDNAKERADIIMYLRSLAAKPEPLPPAPKVAAAAPAPIKKTGAVAPAAPNLPATPPTPNAPSPSAGTAAAPAATAGGAAAAGTSPAPKSPAPGAATPPKSSP